MGVATMHGHTQKSWQCRVNSPAACLIRMGLARPFSCPPPCMRSSQSRCDSCWQSKYSGTASTQLQGLPVASFTGLRACLGSRAIEIFLLGLHQVIHLCVVRFEHRFRPAGQGAVVTAGRTHLTIVGVVLGHDWEWLVRSSTPLWNGAAAAAITLLQQLQCK